MPEREDIAEEYFRVRQGRCFGKMRSRAASLLLLVLISAMATSCDRGDHPAHIGSVAPQFDVSDGSQAATLTKLRGHVVVLNFWASYCVPCIEEVPSLVELQRLLPEVRVVAISSDEDAGAYRQFLAANQVNLVTVRDPSSRIQRLYGTEKIPETYVIDRDGLLRRKFVSAQNWTNPEIVDYLGKL